MWFNIVSILLTLTIFCTLIPAIYYQTNTYLTTGSNIDYYTFQLYVPLESTYSVNFANCSFINSFNYSSPTLNLVQQYNHLSCITERMSMNAVIKVTHSQMPTIISQINYSSFGYDIYYASYLNIFSQFTYQVMVSSVKFPPSGNPPLFQFASQPFGPPTPGETTIILSSTFQTTFRTVYDESINIFSILTIGLVCLLFTLLLVCIIISCVNCFKNKSSSDEYKVLTSDW
jgi:hypothetical protein